MAELVKYENDLVALKVFLGRGRETEVVLSVERAGDPRATLRVTPRELGIPSDFDPGRYAGWEPEFALPGDLVANLQHELEMAHQGEAFRVLWLHLAPPSGFLPLLPWERMLAPLGVPVLRVPNFASFPPLETSELDVAICVSQPLAKSDFDGAAAVAALAGAYAGSLQRDATIHVFADGDTQRRLQAGVVALPPHAVVYDPADAPRSPRVRGGPSIEDSPDMAWNPWLHWIAHALAHRTIEVVHFVTHTYLARNQAALAMSESPGINVDTRWSRFVGPQQLVGFLDHVGAWGVALSVPHDNYSPMGARLLIDDLAHRRAGPILLHNLATDGGAQALAGLLGAMARSEWPDMASDVAVYAHPRQFAEIQPSPSLPYAEQLLAEPRMTSSAEPDQPAWVTLTRRYLEQSTARMFPDTERPTSAVQQAAGEGVRQALEFLDGVLVSYSGGGGGPGAGGMTAGGIMPGGAAPGGIAGPEAPRAGEAAS